MFCPKCGAQLPDGTTFCNACGTPLGEEQPKQPKKAKGINLANLNKKYLLIGGGALAVVVIAVVLIVVLAGGSGYGSPKNAASNYLEAVYSVDVDKLLDCYPDFMIEELMDDLDVASKSELKKAMKDKAEYQDTKPFKVIYCEENYERYEKKDLGDFVDSMERYYDLDEKQLKKITDLCQVIVIYESDGDKDVTKIKCFKYDGNWYPFIDN